VSALPCTASQIECRGVIEVDPEGEGLATGEMVRIDGRQRFQVGAKRRCVGFQFINTTSGHIRKDRIQPRVVEAIRTRGSRWCQPAGPQDREQNREWIWTVHRSNNP